MLKNDDGEQYMGEALHDTYEFIRRVFFSKQIFGEGGREIEARRR